MAALAIVTAPAAAVAAPAAVTYPGISALQDGVPDTRGHLTVTRSGDRAHLDIWLTRGAQTVRTYDEDMTKNIHLVVIAADFSSFQHLHPQLHADGHFTIALGAPKTGTYEIYADTVPHGDAQTVFRFEVPLGGGARGIAVAASAPAGKRAIAGPYTVTLDTTTLGARAESPLHATIARGGKPARDLHPFLGASAHVVLIDTHTLAYVHVHPEMPGREHHGTAGMGAMPGMAMAMPGLAPGASVAPRLLLHVRVSEPGTYRMWLQFRGGNALRVAPFSLTAQ